MNRLLSLLTLLLTVPAALARSGDAGDPAGRYIIEFEQAPVASFEGIRDKRGGWRLEPTSPASTGRKHLELTAPAVKRYRAYLADERQRLLGAMSGKLGRSLTPGRVYELAGFGLTLELEAGEAAQLRGLPGVSSVQRDERVQMLTDAGPGWIGADEVWNGPGGGNRGEGVVVGVLDSGVNWDHPAFADPAPDGFNHVNPLGGRLGLCSLSSVPCNDKLVGVYDFTDEGTNGKDTDGHGTHVASTAVGNDRTAVIDAVTTSFNVPVSGVAPHAALVSYKVCTIDDPNTSEDEDGCSQSAILEAMDQVLADGVPVINYSLGSDARDPWDSGGNVIATRMLNLRSAGVLVVASAGNAGPMPGTISNPANAPWVVAVANISHNRQFLNRVENLRGGEDPPADLVGVGVTSGIGARPIVHAKDFGNALCGTGPGELQPNCEDHTGASNPFPPGTFNGEIVVCDRGTYGRVEKGFNLRQAGAGGYVLANTDAQGEAIVSDDHCLPAVHLGDSDGDRLRSWLDTPGDDHRARISGQEQVLDEAFGDRLAASSSRGPGFGAPGVLKPDLAAPGSSILAAGRVGSGAAFMSGTSMASPHVVGVAALMLSADSSLTPAQLHSLLMMAAVNEDMSDGDGSGAAHAQEVGGGRARAERAVAGGLYLNETRSGFLAADPAIGGVPGELNLPGLVNEACFVACEFRRRVTALRDGAWEARIEGNAGLAGSVTPAAFQLQAGQSQNLIITVDVSDPRLTGRRIDGYVLLENSEDASEQRLPLALVSDPGSVPETVVISTEFNRGSEQVSFEGTAALPAARYESSGLSEAKTARQGLSQDPTRDDPYDDLDSGVYFRTVTIDADGGVVLAETIPRNNGDLDLFVGRDQDGDGAPAAAEELCRSTSPDSVERCLLTDAEAGTYWILVQNWQAEAFSDSVRIRYVGISPGGDGLTVTGPGAIATAETEFDLRLNWNEGRMKSGQRWFGFLTPRTTRAPDAGSLGTVLVELRRGQVAAADPSEPRLDRLPAYALARNAREVFTLAAGEGHGRLFLDVPEGAESLRVSTSSSVDTRLYLFQAQAVFSPPEVPPVLNLDSAQVSTAAAAPDQSLELTGEDLLPGRYYILPVNVSDSEARVSLSVELDAGANTISPVQGLWFNPARDGAGLNLNIHDGQLIIELYTYLEDGTPNWYLAQAPFPQQGNSWSAELNFFQWNGNSALATPVGEIILTFGSRDAMIFSFRLHGRSGSEPYLPIIPELDCDSQGASVARTGLWFIPSRPGFGYSILSLASQQVHINYLYDGLGFPRWVLGQGPVDDAGVLPMDQFAGFCPSCDSVAVQTEIAGSNEISFDDDASGSIRTELDFAAPVPGQWLEAGDLLNLTPSIGCAIR